MLPIETKMYEISIHEQSMNHISLKNRPRCYTKSPTPQDAFRLIPGLISCMHTYGTMTNMKHEVIQLHNFALVVKFLVETIEEVYPHSVPSPGLDISSMHYLQYMVIKQEGLRKAAGAKA